MNNKKIIAVLVLVLVLIQIPLLQADEDLNCAKCGKTISGTYYRVGDMVYCGKECVRATRPDCAVCGEKILKGGFKYKGKHICSEKCLNRLRPKCAICRKPVVGGKGVKSDGVFYCSETCFTQSLPECRMCSKRVKDYIRVKGRNYCKKCYATAKCLQCSLPAGKERLPDRRPFCVDCKRKGIVLPGKAKELFTGIKDLLQEEFGITTDNAIEFRLVDWNELKKVHKESSMKENGLYRKIKTVTQKKMTLFGVDVVDVGEEKVKVEKTIYILSWLDKRHMQIVMAHELMHDWTQRVFPDLEEEMVVEGISEYAAWRTAMYNGYDDLARETAKNTDEIYGDGFRLVRAAAEKEGLTDLFSWVRTGDYKEDVRKAKAARKKQNKDKKK